MDDAKKTNEAPTPEAAAPEAAPQPEQLDVQAMIGEMQGLRNQRNSAFDDAANIFGKLQKLTSMFNGLYAAFAALKNKHEPETGKVPEGPALKDPTPPASIPQPAKA